MSEDITRYPCSTHTLGFNVQIFKLCLVLYLIYKIVAWCIEFLPRLCRALSSVVSRFQITFTTLSRSWKCKLDRRGAKLYILLSKSYLKRRDLTYGYLDSVRFRVYATSSIVKHLYRFSTIWISDLLTFSRHFYDTFNHYGKLIRILL